MFGEVEKSGIFKILAVPKGEGVWPMLIFVDGFDLQRCQPNFGNARIFNPKNPACPLEAVHACENLPNHHFVFSASLQTPTWGRIFSPTKFVRILGSLEFMTLAECRGGGEEERERGPDGCNALFDRFSWKWNLFPFGQFEAKNHRNLLLPNSLTGFH